jgi:AraC family transcriptional regulator
VESVFSPNACIPSHEHVHSFFDLVIEGACTERVGHEARTRTRSTLAFHPAGEVHSSHWSGPEPRCFHIEIPPQLLERVKETSPGFARTALFLGGSPAWLATRLYDEFRYADEVSSLAIEGLVLELLAACARRPTDPRESAPPRWLSRARELLHEHFSTPLALGAVAKSVGVHPAHLARVFRQFHGCSLGDYVRKLRIDFACRRLRSSEAPLVEIALAAGFSDQSHFSNTFRHLMGVSPGAYRKATRSRNPDTTRRSDRTRA